MCFTKCYAVEYTFFEFSFQLRAYKWIEWSTKSGINRWTNSHWNIPDFIENGPATSMLRLRQVIFYILVELMLSRLARRVIVSLTGTEASQRAIQETNASLCSAYSYPLRLKTACLLMKDLGKTNNTFSQVHQYQNLKEHIDKWNSQ